VYGDAVSSYNLYVLFHVPPPDVTVIEPFDPWTKETIPTVFAVG
jgi:hypothetical protein